MIVRILKKMRIFTSLKHKDLELPQSISELHSVVIGLQEQLSKVTLELSISREENSRLMEEIAVLQAENSELRARLNLNSTNSSKPPSSDGYHKTPAFPKKTGGKKGGVKGHHGNTLLQVETPDFIRIHKINKCACGCDLEHASAKLVDKRQVFDLPEPRLEITEHQIFETVCPNCGLIHRGQPPQGVDAPVQYGDGVKAFVVLLNNCFKMPFNEVRMLFHDLFGYFINEATVCSANQTVYNKLEPTIKIIVAKILQSLTAHADETGLRIAGVLKWLHTLSTPLFTYIFVHQKRGKKALESSKSFLSAFYGWLVHDCWSSYFGFTHLKHAICGAHILRELQGLIDNECKWAQIFKIFLLNVHQMPFEKRIQYKELIESRYDKICALADKIEPPPQKKHPKGKHSRTKGRNLLTRLIKYKPAILAFAFNEEVPFTNNQAERDIRPAKLKQKISGCFRTDNGADIYARIESFISTARKHNLNVFKELKDTLNGYNYFTVNFKT